MSLLCVQNFKPNGPCFGTTTMLTVVKSVLFFGLLFLASFFKGGTCIEKKGIARIGGMFVNFSHLLALLLFLMLFVLCEK